MTPIGLIQNFAAACSSGSFFAFPTWYKYLKVVPETIPGPPPTTTCVVKISGVNDVWLIVAAIIEILLRVAGIMAVVFIVYGGFQYLTSQAEPDKLTKARQTITNALVGLILAILAATIVNFIAGSIS